MEGSSPSPCITSTGVLREAASAGPATTNNHPQSKMPSPTQLQYTMYDDFAQYDGIMGASLSPALVEGGGRQSRVLPNLSVDLDYMEPTMIDSCISQASATSKGSYLSDTVDIRSCVLLAHPQPFRTWDGQNVSAPRDLASIRTWLKRFEDRSRHNATKTGEEELYVGTHSMLHQQSSTINDSGRTGSMASMSTSVAGSTIGKGVDHPDPISSSRDFRFQTSKGNATRFARVTKDRLRVHTRRCGQDQGFSLWMRGDVAPYFKDRSECNRKRLSTKAGDIKILTKKRHQRLDGPETVLMQAHRYVNGHISTDSQLASRVERENGRWWWTGNGRRYGVSTILNQSAAHLATQPPQTPWPIAQPIDNRLPVPPPPPVINSTSGFRPICMIHSTQEPEKYWRRKLLPLDVLDPPAKLVAGANADVTIMMRGGQDATEAKAIQAALDCAERVKAEKLRKIRAASRGAW